jgi:hypothetical protein
MAAARLIGLLPVSLVAAKLHTRAPLRLSASKTRPLQIIRAMLHVRAKLLLHLNVQP